MEKPIRSSLGIKFSVIIMLASMLLSVLVFFVSYQLYTKQIMNRYASQGEALVNAVSQTIDWDKVDTYYQTNQTDDEYWATLGTMRQYVAASSAEYLFIVKPQGDGCVYIFDTDEEDSQCELGLYWDWRNDFGDATADLAQGKQIDPIITDEAFGWLLSIYVPFSDSQGNFVGYLGVDYAVQHIIDEEWSFIGKFVIEALLVSLAMTAIFLFILRSLVLKPINKIAQAANGYLVEANTGPAPSSSIARLHVTTRDELQSLAESLQTMEEKIHDYIKNIEAATLRAETDSMTTLYNREAFEKRVNEALDSGSFDGFFVFMMIDLDKFKSINDTWGHNVGDEILTACGQTIRSNFRPSDYIARIGGDEFAVFYKSPAVIDDVESRARAICESVKDVVINDTVRFTVSIGVAVVDGNVRQNYQSLYIMADKALYDL
ncbi:MAG: sensor domain-containing diguanylate cyclase, partial [Eggerthellaceae bacterium]|nr:sensor domain-containing diguanylate cyclase [Eggerthellaceae bacterium]